VEDPLQIGHGVSVPLSEIELRASRSSGPGGQHANVTASRVEAVFDVEGSRSLSDEQKRRVMARCGPVVRASAQDTRSQARNRELALDRLRSRLANALAVQRPRRATKPTRAARRRRLDSKRRRGELKRSRQPPGPE
jgi:ribosome-associated protein